MKIHGELKALYLDDEFSGKVELASDDFYVLLRAEIGMAGRPGGDYYTFFAASLAGLTRKFEEEGPKFVRATYVIDKFDMAAIEKAVEKRVSATSGSSYREIAEKLSRFMDWEFADYQPYEGS